MEEIGEIVKISGKIVEIRIMKSGKCHTCGICGVGKNGDMLLPVEINLIKSTSPIRINDKVKIELKDSIMLKNILVLYFLPINFLVVGYFFGWLLNKKIFHFNGEFINIAFSFLFLLIFKLLLKAIYNTLHISDISALLTVSKIE